MRGHNALLRQWKLLRALSERRQPQTVAELARELETSQKTIRRDLNLFRRVGFPLKITEGRFGQKRYTVPNRLAGSGLVFYWDELLALYCGQQFLEPLAGTPLWEASRRAFAKIRGAVPAQTLQFLEKMAGRLHHTRQGVSDYSRQGELIDALTLAIEEHRIVHLTYQSLSATEPVTYDAYPYALVWHRHALYLVGYSPRYGELRTWKVNRLSDVAVETMRFNRPEDFDLNAYMRQAFGVYHGSGQVTIKVRFSPRVARYVQEHQWHETEKLSLEADGSLTAEYALSSTEEIKRWILSFGAEAEVLAPHQLREDICAEMEAMARLYANGNRTKSTSH